MTSYFASRQETFDLPCGDETHQVVFAKSGALSLPHHPAWEDDLALVRLGGVSYGCLNVVRELRSRTNIRTHQFPSAIGDYLHRLIFPVRQLGGFGQDILEEKTWHSRYRKHAGHMAASLVHTASLLILRQFGSNSYRLHIDESVSPTPYTIRSDWLKEVYQKGLAVVNGNVVLAFDCHGNQHAVRYFNGINAVTAVVKSHEKKHVQRAIPKNQMNRDQIWQWHRKRFYWRRGERVVKAA